MEYPHTSLASLKYCYNAAISHSGCETTPIIKTSSSARLVCHRVFGNKQFPSNFPPRLPFSFVLQFYTNAAAAATDVFSSGQSHKLPHLLRQRRFFVRYKTGIAVLSITCDGAARRSKRSRADDAAGEGSRAKLHCTVIFCILLAPAPGLPPAPAPRLRPSLGSITQ